MTRFRDLSSSRKLALLIVATSAIALILSSIALVMVIGVLVDDSIVVLENIYRHVRKGEDLNSSVIEGVREVVSTLQVK